MGEDLRKNRRCQNLTRGHKIRRLFFNQPLSLELLLKPPASVVIERMQIAGEICKVCENPVVSEIEAVACPHCQNLSHRSCLESVEQICPACGHGWGEPFKTALASDSIHHSNSLFIEGAFQRPKTSLLYRFSLVVVSLAMILLPLLYLAVVALFAYGVYRHAIQFVAVMGWPIPGLLGITIRFTYYFGVLFAGSVMTLFLVKPIFARRASENEYFSLEHADAPQLFSLIGWICRSLNAPIPSRIDVDCTVNAGAGFRSGWRSLFGNDIVLCLGLPLVAGMNLSQMAGIIAHEYGHFSQGTAMRAHYIIRRINLWFFRVVYERDEWDQYLVHASERENQDWRLALIFFTARAGGGLARGILWLFMATGSLLSSFMSRQMEFDADQYELKMSGSETFVTTVLRLQQLNVGLAMAQKQLAEKWKKEKKLFDQIPDFIVGRANEISAEAQERHYAQAFKRKTQLFDSHPSDAERMRRARAAGEPGVFHETAPATSLFANYPELARRLTLFFYRDLIGPGFSPASLVSLEQTQARAEHDYAADKESVRRYFLGIVSDLRPLAIKESKSLVVRRQETLSPEIQACRRQMEESLPVAQEAQAEFIQTEARLLQAMQAAQLLQAGFQFDPSEFGLADSDVEHAQAEAREAWQAADAQLQMFETAGKSRLLDTVQLLRSPQMTALIPNAVKLHDEAREIIWILSRLSDTFEPLLELRKDCATLEVLLRYRRSQPAADNVTMALENLGTGIQERVNAIQEQNAQIRYPFHHATEQVMVSEYARNKEYQADPFELALREGKSHTEKLLNLHIRLLGNLIMICEKVDRVAG